MNDQERIRFLIVGTYRSGSSAVTEAMNSHPGILCGLEWTLRTPFWKKLHVAKTALTGDFSTLLPRHRDAARSGFSPATRVIGFKRLFRSSDKWMIHPKFAPALAVDRLEAHLDWLASDSSIRVIHIVRRDNIAWLRSKVLADASGKYSGSKYPDGLQLRIDVNEAKRRVATKTWIDGRLAALSVSNPYCRVDYESFAADNRRVARELVSFLGCDPEELPERELRHQSQSASSAASLLNIDDVRHALRERTQVPSERMSL